MIFFTADEHYGHANIIKFCNRPFENDREMDEDIMAEHNEVVGPGDTVIHGGDVSWRSVNRTIEIVKRLNGKHIMIKGSHDRVMEKIAKKQPDLFEYVGYIYELMVHNKYHIIICHYNMRTWPRSHYNSWQLYGHSHGRLEPVGKQHDIGVDSNDFRPVSFDQLKDIMDTKPDNPNYVGGRSR